MLRPLALGGLGLLLVAVGLLPFEALAERIGLSREVPFDVGPAAVFVAAQSGLVVLGAAAILATLVQRLRSRRFGLLAIALAAVASAWAWPRAEAEVGLSSIRRLAFWRNGSPQYTAPAEYLAWAESFAERLEGRPSVARQAYFVHLRLGDYFLRIGEYRKALSQFEDALDNLQAHREEVPEELYQKYLTTTWRWLAVANLRRGEAEFCIDQYNPLSCIYPLRGTGIWANPIDARTAQDYLSQILDLDPGQVGAAWLLNVAHMVAGTFPKGVPERWLLPESAWKPVERAPVFVNVGQELGVDHLSISGGAIVEDFDGDGFLDLMASCLHQEVPMVYYHNDGDGTFSDWSHRSGVDQVTGSLSIVQGDYDGDGWVDVFVARGAWMGEDGRIPNVLLRNRGDGTFEDVTEAAGLADPAWPCLAAAWCDYDQDGDLDLYVGNERLSRGRFAPSQLFQNQGDGTFVDVAKEAGVTNDRFSRGVCWGDYDNDGDFDLYVSNFGQPNRLYRNRGDGTFEDVAPELGVDLQTENPRKQRSFQSWFFDVDGDGWLDLFCAPYPLGGVGGSVEGTARSYFGLEPTEEVCRFWLNDGRGGFREATEEYGLLRTLPVMGANYADVDNDGFQDIYLGTGAPSFEVIVPNVLFRNVDGERFGDATVASGLGHFQKGHGVAFGDVDNDGDVDLYAQLGGWYLDGRYYNALFRNEGDPRHHWLTLRLRGRRSNSFGVGTRVKAVVLEDGREREIHAIAGTGASFGGNSLQVELGLGRAERLLRVELDWPVEGPPEVLEGLPMDRILEVVEGEGWSVVETPRLRLGALPE